MRPGLLLVSLCGACARPEDAPASTEGPPDISIDVTPVWTPDDLAAAVLAVAALPPVAPADVRAAYLDLLGHGDAACPGDTTDLVGADLRGCTAASGYTYAGVATLIADADGGGWVLSGDFAIVDPDGGRFYGGGAVSEGGDPTASDGVWGASWSGEWGWTGQPGWLGGGVSTYWSESGGTADGQPSIRLDQGLTYGGVSFWFDGLARAPGTCADGVTGAVAVRDPSGSWYTLDYGDTCGTCAALAFDGDDAGTLCLDLGPWLDALAAARAAG